MPTETAGPPSKRLPSTIVSISSTTASNSGRLGQLGPPDPERSPKARAAFLLKLPDYVSPNEHLPVGAERPAAGSAQSCPLLASVRTGGAVGGLRRPVAAPFNTTSDERQDDSRWVVTDESLADLT